MLFQGVGIAALLRRWFYWKRIKKRVAVKWFGPLS